MEKVKVEVFGATLTVPKCSNCNQPIVRFDETDRHVCRQEAQ